MADLSLCPKCGEPLSDDYGDAPDSLCFACRKPTGKLCDLLIAIESSGDSPERLEAWRSIRPRLRDCFDYPAAGWEERLQDWLHVAHGIDWETALGTPLPEIIGLLEAGPTPTTEPAKKRGRKRDPLVQERDELIVELAAQGKNTNDIRVEVVKQFGDKVVTKAGTIRKVMSLRKQDITARTQERLKNAAHAAQLRPES